MLSAQAQDDPAWELVRLVNDLRASHGLPLYEVDPILMNVAQAQASWSAANNHIGHDGPGGSSPNGRAQAAGYGGGSRSFATENAAHGTASIHTPELVVSMWQGDWGHLNAMISPEYEHIGVGFAEANGYSWYVMMVGWVDEGTAPEASPQETSAVDAPYVPFVLSEPDEFGAIYHEVQPGQTAWTIAAYYEVDLAELLALNNLREDSILHPGDVLLIRPPVSSTDTPLSPPQDGATSEPTSATRETTSTPDHTPVPNVQAPRRSVSTPFLLFVGLGAVLLLIVKFATRGSS